ncbi:MULTISPECIES: hypothetical protein [unclassified Sphingopyxis]|uniref:hypothetical protein n=1 Tax=unclassified Sphingopyxis TaxID=2614943 RepID=UPI000737A710|nr:MULTISPECIES: hypothetical protein [unclassified Sphingopyxis]KTE43002.1 hypothetical protein ATE62_04615 [Sphingopyxis sp. HIX]KTE85171.1 hypothetical protein ATE72_04745 [Sphingopyxis sp. HXXIV]
MPQDTSHPILRKTLKHLLLPALIQRNFFQASFPREYRDFQTTLHEPLKLLHRIEDDILHILSVQMFTLDRATLALRFVAVPPTGILDTSGDILPQDGPIIPDFANGGYELLRNPRRVKYFSADRWWRKTREEHIEAMVREVIDCLDEVDAALRRGEIGPHIQRHRDYIIRRIEGTDKHEVVTI